MVQNLINLSTNNVNCNMKCNKSTQKGVVFLMERKHYFILRSLVTKYGKDNVINTVIR